MIDLETATMESNEILKKQIGLDFNVKATTEKLIEVSGLSQSRKREKENAIKDLTIELDNHLARCHLILHLREN